MNNFATIAGLAVAAVAATASADLLISVDLTVANQVTISATDGLSAATASGSDVTGIYLNGFYNGAGSALLDTYLSGDFSNAENPTSDGSPALFRAGAGSDTGLNVFSWSTASTVTFTAGELAFIGSATFELDAASYADMLAGNTSGDLYFPADDISDVAGAVVLGTWNVVPAPSAMALLGLGGLVTTRRRR